MIVSTIGRLITLPSTAASAIIFNISWINWEECTGNITEVPLRCITFFPTMLSTSYYEVANFSATNSLLTCHCSYNIRKQKIIINKKKTSDEQHWM